MSEENKTSQQKFCSHCGEVVDWADRFCAACGGALTPEAKDTSNIHITIDKDSIRKSLGQYAYSELNQSRLKDFIVNNLALVHFIYLIIFLVGLVNSGWGVLVLIVGLLGIYVLAVRHEGRDSKWNQQLVDYSHQAASYTKDRWVEMRGKQAEGASPAQSSQNQGQTTSTSQASKSEVPIRVQSSFGIPHALVLVAALVALYGLLGGQFFSYSGLSLFGTLNALSDLLGNISYYGSGIGSFFGSEDIQSLSSMTNLLSIILLALALAFLILPVLVAIFILFKKYSASFILSLLQLVLIGISLFALFGLSDSYLGAEMSYYLGEYMSGQIGLPAIAFVVGSVGMVLCSIAAHSYERRLKGGEDKV